MALILELAEDLLSDPSVALRRRSLPRVFKALLPFSHWWIKGRSRRILGLKAAMFSALIENPGELGPAAVHPNHAKGDDRLLSVGILHLRRLKESLN